MTILAWIVLGLFIFGLLYVVAKEHGNSFLQNCLNVLKGVSILAVCCLGGLVVTWAVLELAGDPTQRVYTPTILVCNGVTVAESVNGFSLQSKSGVYIDYYGDVSYTPKGGETCKEFSKEK